MGNQFVRTHTHTHKHIGPPGETAGVTYVGMSNIWCNFTFNFLLLLFIFSSHAELNSPQHSGYDEAGSF